MGLVRYHLTNGDGIVVYNQAEFDSLMWECYELGYYWRRDPWLYNRKKGDIYIITAGVLLIYGLVKWVNRDIVLIDYTSTKSIPFGLMFNF